MIYWVWRDKPRRAGGGFELGKDGQRIVVDRQRRALRRAAGRKYGARRRCGVVLCIYTHVWDPDVADFSALVHLA